MNQNNMSQYTTRDEFLYYILIKVEYYLNYIQVILHKEENVSQNNGTLR